VHNIYLSVWAELGTVGLILYSAALLTGIGAAVRDLWARPDPAGTALLGGVIALLAIGLLDHYPYTLIQFQTALWGLLAVREGQKI
jgi:O-antigen ligase